MSNWRNWTCPGVQLVLNQEITSPVLRHWLTEEEVRRWAVSFSRIFLLTRPTSDLAGYLLSQIGDILPQQSHGLYRDDGLVMLTDTPGPRMERIRKDLFATFRREGLKITVSPPSTSVDFLDVTFRSDGSFRPFRKAEKVTKYVHRQSNHPPSIIRNIPEMIADRINSISSCKEVFDDAKPYYEDALKSSGYMDSCMTYNTQAGEAKTPRNRRRKRRVLWFNPPFSVTVETNVGRKFFNLLEKHFPRDNPLHKILNRNGVKVS